MKTVYVCGPMRGLPLYNFPAFDDARDRLRALGWNVISPADLDREVGFNPHSDHESPEFLRTAIKRDLEALFACDAIAMLPGWENSKGANVEHALAVYLGLDILDAQTGEVLR